MPSSALYINRKVHYLSAIKIRILVGPKRWKHKDILRTLKPLCSIGQDVNLAARLLGQGNLVAIPTETVYGLAADASSLQALDRLFSAKGRPRNHPVIVHIASVETLDYWAKDIPEVAYELAEKFWPGPLTLIFKKQSPVLSEVTGGQDTVAIRVPRHDLTLALLREFKGGLAAPSANRFGRLSPTTAQDVFNEFQHEVSYILDGGTCHVGIKSTIVDLSSEHPRILRPGMLNQETLAKVKGLSNLERQKDQPKVRAPGTLKSHYSPVTRVRLVDEGDLQSMFQSLNSNGSRAAALSFQKPKDSEETWIAVEREPEIYAQNLYSNLRRLDGFNCDWILVERVPNEDRWSGIRDRLERASYREDSE